MPATNQPRVPRWNLTGRRLAENAFDRLVVYGRRDDFIYVTAPPQGRAEQVEAAPVRNALSGGRKE